MAHVEFRIAVVDGEELQVVERESLEGVDATVTSESIAKLLRWTTGFVLQHDGFFVACRLVGPKKIRQWLVLLATATGLQRVHLERVTCDNCRALVDIANPTTADLYEVLAQENEALARAWRQPPVPCPKCGATLGRRAIWAEQANTGERKTPEA